MDVTVCQIKSILTLRGHTLCPARAPHWRTKPGEGTRGHQCLPAHTGHPCLKPSQCQGRTRVHGPQVPALVADAMLPGGVLQGTGGGLPNPDSSSRPGLGSPNGPHLARRTWRRPHPTQMFKSSSRHSPRRGVCWEKQRERQCGRSVMEGAETRGVS